MKKFAFLLLVTMFFSVSSEAQINTYQINEQINGVGSLTYDIDGDTQDDFTFEVIELSTNVFAARVANIGFSSYLDNSTFHYPDALNFDDTVAGYFNNGSAVLGTFTGAGLFSGAGNKYLGIKIFSGIDSYLGWILLNCNSSNDTLQIISTGYNTIPNEGINAGQTIAVNSIEGSEENLISVFPNPATDFIRVEGFEKSFYYVISNQLGAQVQTGFSNGNIEIEDLSAGLYFLQINGGQDNGVVKVWVN